MNVNHNEYISFIPDPRGNSHDYRYSLNSNYTIQKFGKNCLNFDFDKELINTINFYKTNKNNNLWK